MYKRPHSRRTVSNIIADGVLRISHLAIAESEEGTSWVPIYSQGREMIEVEAAFQYVNEFH